MGRVARLGVLGGTFDPIHIGHLLIAQTVYEALSLDLVLLVPAGRAPHRTPKGSAGAEVRVAMVAAAIEGDGRFGLSRVDVDRPAPQYTADTLTLLAGEYGVGPDELYFIVGSDSVEMLPTWYRPDLVATRCRLAATRRSGHPLDLDGLALSVPETRGRVDVVEMPGLDISSTILRTMVRNGQSIRYWTPPAVERLVLEARLYTAGEAAPVTSGRSG